MRVITGTAKGTCLETLEGVATRPTAERTKEAVFSILQFDIAGKRVLDLFGGSGQLALESLSRGAKSAFVSDISPEACEVIKRNARKTHLFDKMRIICSDYNSVIKSLSGRETFDIIFLDPPYSSDFISIAVKKIAAGGLLAENGYIVCESDREVPFTYDGLLTYRHNRYGKAYITVLKNEKMLYEVE